MLKRWTAMLAAWLMLCSAAAAELLCVSGGGVTALVTADGGEIVPPGVLDALFCIEEDALYAAGTETGDGLRYALMNASGERLTEAEYEMLAPLEGDVIFRQNGLFGVMSAAGEVLVPAEWTQLTGDGTGWLAISGDPFDDHADDIFRIEPDGSAAETDVSTISGLTAFSSGRMPYQDSYTELYGYLNGRGGVTIEPTLTWAGAFENGLACAALDGLQGAIGPDGEWVIDPEYDFLDRGDGILVALAERSRCVVYDEATARQLFSVEGEGLQAAVAGAYPIVLEGDRLYAYTRDGELFAEAEAGATFLRGAGGQLLLSEGDWGTECVSVLDENGNRMERRDQHLLPLGDSRYAFLEMTAAAYRSDALGEIRYSCDYDSMRFGLMDLSGTALLPAVYTEIIALSGDRFLTVEEDGVRMTDSDGNTLWSCLTAEE